MRATRVTSRVRPAEYGTFAIIGSAGMILSFLAALGVPSGLVRTFFDHDTEKEREEVGTWVVSELACRAAGFGLEVIAASSTCPALREGLRRNGFVDATPIPITWWPGRAALPEPHRLGSNTSDTSFNPYPPSRWGDDAEPGAATDQPRRRGAIR